MRSIAAIIVGIALLTAPESSSAANATTDYFTVKAAVQAMFDHGDLAYRFGHVPKFAAHVAFGHNGDLAETCMFPGGCYGFDGCYEPTLLPADAPLTDRYYAQVAWEALDFQEAMTALRYPRAAWAPTIQQYETYELARAAKAPSHSPENELLFTRGDRYASDGGFFLANELQRALLRYDQQHAQKRAGFFLASGCGAAGDLSLAIETVPSALAVFIIPTFYYDVCRAQRVNADDLNACGHWREVLAAVEPVSGEYHYFARWAGGIVRRGIFLTSDYYSANDRAQDAGATTARLTLRKP
jgi:hypothetical protein